VINSIRSGYYDVLLAQRTIDVNEELVRIGQQGVELTEKRLAARAISKAELLQTQIEAQMAELSLVRARNNHDAAWRRLTAVLGRPEMQPQPLAGEVDRDLPQFDWRETLDHLLTQSPELAEAYAAVETARNALALQCAQRIPNFQVATGVKYDESARFTLADVEIAVPLPVFDRNQGNILAAQSDLAAAQSEVQRVELDLRNRLANAFEQYANASRQVEVYSGSIVPNAQESLRLADIGYRAGHFGYLTLLTAQRTYFGVSLEYLESLKEFWARSVELEGMLLSGGLERPE
jgi:cobalt-zinc-cadmium efflux system outer membrane protein